MAIIFQHHDASLIDPVLTKTKSGEDIKLIKYNNQYSQFVKTSNDDILYPSYVKDGLTCWLDGNYNTRNGPDDTAFDTWEDLSGNNNDFTIENNNGSSVWWAYGYDDNKKNALGYWARGINPRGQGANCKISRSGFNPFTMTTGWTLEFCLNTTGVVNYYTLFRTITDSNYREAWLSSNGYANIRIYNNTTVTTNTAVYSAETYHTITFTREAASSRTAAAYINIYVDGAWIRSSSTSATDVTVSKFFIFSRNADQYNVSGTCFGFRSYNRPLAQSEVAYNAQLDQCRYNTAQIEPVGCVQRFDILRDGVLSQANETNSRFTQQENGQWIKSYTSRSESQGALWTQMDVTNYERIYFLYNATTAPSSNYPLTGFVSTTLPTATTRPGTTVSLATSGTGRKYGRLNCANLFGTQYVGINTGVSQGTIEEIYAWTCGGAVHQIEQDDTKPVSISAVGANISYEWSNNNMTLTVRRTAGTGTQGVNLTANYSIKLTYTSYRESGWNSYSVSHGTNVNSTTAMTAGQSYAYLQTGSQQSASAYTTWVFNFVDTREIRYLSATCTQGSNSYGTQVTSTVTAPTNAAQLSISSFNCGTSYGNCETVLIINGTTVVNQVRSYTGSGFTGSATGGLTLPATYALTSGQTIQLKIRASYNPDVSGQHQSTATMEYKFLDANNNIILE